MAEIHKRGHIKGEPNNPVCNCNGTTYFNCGSNCECCDTGQLTGDRVANNPSDPRSFGFNNNYDGRVRGGVKTPQAFDKRNSIVGREFNIFDRNERKNNRPWWQFGLGGGNVSCSCNKAGNSCKCDGCLGGATC